MADISSSGSSANSLSPAGGIYTGSVTPSVPTPATYANTNVVTNYINTGISTFTQLLSDLEGDISTYSLAVALTDTDLIAAIAEEWPAALGTPTNSVSYAYYNYLLGIDSRSADFIVNKFEEAARGETGSNTLDLIKLTQIILQEYSLVQEFISTYVNNLNDSSEHRAVEAIQDWAQTAITHAGRFRSFFTKADSQRSYPQAQLDAITTQEAYATQALFKVNLNKLNNDLVYVINFLKKNFYDHATIFYHNFLGPALSFRINVSSTITPIMPGLVGKDANLAAQSLDKNFAVLLADQTRRYQLFEDKMGEIEVHLDRRDQFRGYIIQLGQKGKSLVLGTSGTIVRGVNNASNDSYFNQLSSLPSATPSFQAPHSALDGTTDPAAHPQYLLKSGGTVTGDILINPGVTVDGMSPSGHRHRGVDGTPKIHGSDIIGSSLGSGSVDTNITPAVPTGLVVASQVVKASGGTSQVDVTISWDSLDGNTWEVQVAPITD